MPVRLWDTTEHLQCRNSAFVCEPSESQLVWCSLHQLNSSCDILPKPHTGSLVQWFSRLHLEVVPQIRFQLAAAISILDSSLDRADRMQQKVLAMLMSLAIPAASACFHMLLHDTSSADGE